MEVGALRIPAVDIAGKLSALLSRSKARGLFDSRLILAMENLDFKRLCIAFVVYSAMDRKDWRTVSTADVHLDGADLVNQLVPTLHNSAVGGLKEVAEYGDTLVKECQQRLSAVLPFTDSEQAFLDLLLEWGKFDASILTSDTTLQKRIQAQPSLKWKALNVRHHKGLT